MLFLLAYWYLVYIYIRLVLCYSYLPMGTWYIYAWFCAILTCLLVLSIYTPGFVLFLLAYIWVLSIYTPGFVLFLLAYWYLYIYAWFCAIPTCLLVLVYIRLVLCYSYLPIYWYLVYIRLVLCYSYLPIGTCIYTPGFVLFLLAYWYLVYIRLVLCYSYLPIYWYLVYIRLVLCYSYLPIGTCISYAWFCAIPTCLLVLSIYTPGFVLFLLAYWYLYIYAWFCAILTCLLVLVYIRLVLCYSYLPILVLSIYTPGFVLFLLAYCMVLSIHCIYAWFCAIPTCLLVLSIYTPGFVLFLLAYLYLVYIILVLCYSYLRIDT